MDTETLLILVSLFFGLIVLFAIVRLFSIDNTLKEILNELRSSGATGESLRL